MNAKICHEIKDYKGLYIINKNKLKPLTMSDCKQVPEGRDPILWEIARKRAGFKNHAVVYLIVNGFLWAVWYFTNYHLNEFDGINYPWPIWTTLGWGVGLAFHFAGVYIFPKSNSIQREYDQLKTNNK